MKFIDFQNRLFAFFIEIRHEVLAYMNLRNRNLDVSLNCNYDINDVCINIFFILQSIRKHLIQFSHHVFFQQRRVRFFELFFFVVNCFIVFKLNVISIE